jgi:enoyl-CoA hydratase/carnithine racemase
MSIRTSSADGVFSIEIARPEKKNALTVAMYQELAAAVAAAHDATSVRCLLIHGQPDIFTAGNDLEDFLKNPPRDENAPVFQFMAALGLAEKPVVAAVNGAAVGIGTTMLLHCDLVYVSDEARLAMPFTSLGLVAEFASSLLFPQLVGRAKAAEKLLLGDPMSGAEAVELHVANAVLPAPEVLPHARRVAERFNGLPPTAVRETKKLLTRAGHAAVMEQIGIEGQVFTERLRSPEAREAFQAFFEKRKPDFSKF